MDGVAVATMLISMAERNIASITEPMMTRRPATGGDTGATSPGPSPVREASPSPVRGRGEVGGSGARGPVRSVSAIRRATISHRLLQGWSGAGAPVYHQ